MFGLNQMTLIAIAASLVIGVAGGWKWRDYQADKEALKAANQQLQDVKTALLARDKLSAEDAQKSKTLEEVIAAMKETKAESQIVREKEYVTKIVYANCVVPDSGLQLLNQRIANRFIAADPGKRESALPATEAAGRAR